MPNSDLRSPHRFLSKAHWIRLSVAQLASAGLVATALPASAFFYSTPASDTTYRSTSADYRTCVAQITGAGIVAADAATACAAALYPRDLSKCVTNIDAGTALTSADAIANCTRVRRPVELATCVVDIGAIDNPTETAPLLNIVDHCRRSLLPLRFSACVVGLRSQVDFATSAALSNCIAATNRPRNVLPNFMPSGMTSTEPPTAQPAPDQLQQAVPETTPSAPTPAK
ncbi:MAG: hypothetical protein KME15_03085 [Drouetiella hepatica Uher 2000/2452]|jgi:hypothetical protein|uniref:Uncharacterized protein n=1 Tax=Drouetiella hepatica Uher 2000/2452 TaxID=904376 RepID=A0A951Q7B8_9CYAN|nr:hypothetical protein [Drouetiella hepatica Uher 2000/2452]